MTIGIFLGSFLFIKGLKCFIGLNSYKNDLIKLIIALELLLLGVSLLFFHYGFQIDDGKGSLFSLISLILAGCESAIILSIYIAYYPKRGTLSLS